MQRDCNNQGVIAPIMQGCHEIAAIESCAAPNHSRAVVLSALAHQHGCSNDLRNRSIGAWLLNCMTSGDADGAD
jgi:hypothetical protein